MTNFFSSWTLLLLVFWLLEEYLEFIEAMEVRDALLGFLLNDLLQSLLWEAATVFRLFTSIYLSILVLDDRALFVRQDPLVAEFCSFSLTPKILRTFYCDVINPSLISGSYSSMPAIKVLSSTEYTILETRWMRL